MGRKISKAGCLLQDKRFKYEWGNLKFSRLSDNKVSMDNIKAIGFDLFNTLITVEPHALREAVDRLMGSLQQKGVRLDQEKFKRAHREAALRFVQKAWEDGRETHNRFWISAALRSQNYDIAPDDPLIASAVEAYFSVFLEDCRLIPGTSEMLETLHGRYRIGLLSNFTHPPAAKNILDHVGLTRFFDVILISGELGYRKPHPVAFQSLIDRLGVEKHRILYIGDDPEPDINGARMAGLQAVWTTYVRDQHIPFAQGILAGDPEEPDCEVYRISRWEELLDLLKN